MTHIEASSSRRRLLSGGLPVPADDDKFALGGCQIGRAWLGRVPSAHGRPDVDLRRACTDETTQPSFSVPGVTAHPPRFPAPTFLGSRLVCLGLPRVAAAIGAALSSFVSHCTLTIGALVPEGHTIYRHAREHNRSLRGRVVRADSPQGRFAAGASLVDGRTLLRAEAVGKHLFHQYDGQVWLHVHLGLYGEWRTGAQPMPPARGALRLRLWTDAVWWELRGATACEVLTRPEVTAIRTRLGPDPLRRNADPDRAYARIGRSRAPIAALLMDQSVLAGVGNVYRAELLFRHGIDPYRQGQDVSAPVWAAMWDDLVALMRDGVRRGQIVTSRPPYRRRSRVFVYRRAGEPCLVCGTTVRTQTLLARNLFWCPVCQAATGSADESGNAAW